MSRKIQALVAQHIDRWRTVGRDGDDDVIGRDGPPAVIAMAHQLGSRGELIANQISGQLALPIYDREVLQFVAERPEVYGAVVETLPDEARPRLEAILGALSRDETPPPDERGRALTRAVVALWQHGPCILVGHGCVHIVPRQHALTIHVVASEPFRIRQVAERLRLTAEQACALVRRTDAERAALHQRHFDKSVDDILAYDVTLDATLLSIEAAASVIMAAMRGRFDPPNGE